VDSKSRFFVRVIAGFMGAVKLRLGSAIFSDFLRGVVLAGGVVAIFEFFESLVYGPGCEGEDEGNNEEVDGWYEIQQAEGPVEACFFEDSAVEEGEEGQGSKGEEEAEDDEKQGEERDVGFNGLIIHLGSFL